MPPYKVGVGALPSYNNVQALNVEYYSQALQSPHRGNRGAAWITRSASAGRLGMGTEFDTENLLRMDAVTQVTAIRDAVGAGVMSPNEGRAKLDLKPVEGGKSPYLQQQNYLACGTGQARCAGRSVRAQYAAAATRCAARAAGRSAVACGKRDRRGGTVHPGFA